MVVNRVQCVLLLQLLLGFVYVHGVRAQSQEALNERFQSQIAGVTRDVSVLQEQDIDARLSVLEANMTEVTWLGRCVATAVVGQLALAVFGKQKKG